MANNADPDQSHILWHLIMVYAVWSGITVQIYRVFPFQATFQTPFSALGQSPEGCSSYTFPKLMGAANASELLLFNKKISAAEAFNRNLVTEVIPDGTFAKETQTKVESFAKLPREVCFAFHISFNLLEINLCKQRRGNEMSYNEGLIIGIKHGFSCINIRQVPWEVLKIEAEGRGFQHLPRDLANVNALKNHVRSLLLHRN